MSDIIYTPPASSGGTTINSNNNFIPVRQNATTFVDSLLFSTTTILKSVFSGTDKGIIFDYLNSIFVYGNYNTGMTANTNNQEVYLLSNSLLYGFLDGVNNLGYFGGGGARLNFDGNLNKCNIGDGNGNFNSTFLEVDDFNRIIETSIGNPIGLKLDFNNREYWLGDFNGISNGTSIKIDDFNRQIFTTYGANDNGFYLNFQNYRFYFGDYNGFNNSTHLYIADNAKFFQINAVGGDIEINADVFTFNGAITTASASGPSPLGHLQVTINGTPCVIQLLNP